MQCYQLYLPKLTPSSPSPSPLLFPLLSTTMNCTPLNYETPQPFPLMFRVKNLATSMRKVTIKPLVWSSLNQSCKRISRSSSCYWRSLKIKFYSQKCCAPPESKSVGERFASATETSYKGTQTHSFS